MDQVKSLIKKRLLFHDTAPAIDSKPATPINDFIFMSSGTSNAYMVCTKKARIIINTGMGFEALLRHKPAFDSQCAMPTPYIITTQGHVDHVGGVAQFRDTDTRYIAQLNNQACQHDDALIKKRRESQAYIWFQKTIDAAVTVAKKQPKALVQDIPSPDITFDDQFEISQDGLDLVLLAVPGGETIDSCAVHLPQHNIVFNGNQFGPLFPHFPNFNTIRGDKYRWAEPYLKSLLRIKALEPEILITGHFDPIIGKELIQLCLTRLHDAVQYIFEQTMHGIAAGHNIDQMMREIQLPEKLYVGQNYGKVTWAVRTFWEAHMGWFKAQHSSELYATTPHEMMSDLAQLATAPVVLGRAQQYIKENKLQEALLLVEAVLQDSKHNTAALALAIEIHKALLNRSDNFWESGWLQSELTQLEKLANNSDS